MIYITRNNIKEDKCIWRIKEEITFMQVSNLNLFTICFEILFNIKLNIFSYLKIFLINKESFIFWENVYNTGLVALVLKTDCIQK